MWTNDLEKKIQALVSPLQSFITQLPVFVKLSPASYYPAIKEKFPFKHPTRMTDISLLQTVIVTLWNFQRDFFPPNMKGTCKLTSSRGGQGLQSCLAAQWAVFKLFLYTLVLNLFLGCMSGPIICPVDTAFSWLMLKQLFFCNLI